MNNHIHWWLSREVNGFLALVARRPGKIGLLTNPSTRFNWRLSGSLVEFFQILFRSR